MAFEFGFYNSINGDRKYNANHFGQIFDGVINDGVFAGIGDKLFVTPNGGMGILVGTGKAWFNHTWNLNTTKIPLTLSPSHVVLTRYDAVVLEVNETQDAYGRENSIKVIEGAAAAANPQWPALVNTDYIHQYPLAYVQVPAGATEIIAANIDIKVGTPPCPFVTGILQTVDISGLFANWNSQFDVWFSNLQAQLTDNVVTNLQNQINNCLKRTDLATDADINAGTAGKVVQASQFGVGVPRYVYRVGDIYETSRGDPPPDGTWVYCDGQEYSPSQYPQGHACLEATQLARFLFSSKPTSWAGAPGGTSTGNILSMAPWRPPAGHDYLFYGWKFSIPGSSTSKKYYYLYNVNGGHWENFSTDAGSYANFFSDDFSPVVYCVTPNWSDGLFFRVVASANNIFVYWTSEGGFRIGVKSVTRLGGAVSGASTGTGFYAGVYRDDGNVWFVVVCGGNYPWIDLTAGSLAFVHTHSTTIGANTYDSLVVPMSNYIPTIYSDWTGVFVQCLCPYKDKIVLVLLNKKWCRSWSDSGQSMPNATVYSVGALVLIDPATNGSISAFTREIRVNNSTGATKTFKMTWKNNSTWQSGNKQYIAFDPSNVFVEFCIWMGEETHRVLNLRDFESSSVPIDFVFTGDRGTDQYGVDFYQPYGTVHNFFPVIAYTYGFFLVSYDGDANGMYFNLYYSLDDKRTYIATHHASYVTSYASAYPYAHSWLSKWACWPMNVFGREMCVWIGGVVTGHYTVLLMPAKKAPWYAVPYMMDDLERNVMNNWPNRYIRMA